MTKLLALALIPIAYAAFVYVIVRLTLWLCDVADVRGVELDRVRDEGWF